MKSIESIIADHRIDNPTDASLVRLAGAVASLPDTDISDILQRSSFPNQSDQKLAAALASAVRFSGPVPVRAQSSILPWLLVVALAAAAVTLAVKSVGDSRTIASLNQQVNAQAKELAQQVERLQMIATTNEKFASSVAAGQSEAAKIYTDAQAKLSSAQANALAENARLKQTNAQLQQQVETLRLKLKENPSAAEDLRAQ